VDSLDNELCDYQVADKFTGGDQNKESPEASSQDTTSQAEWIAEDRHPGEEQSPAAVTGKISFSPLLALRADPQESLYQERATPQADGISR